MIWEDSHERPSSCLMRTSVTQFSPPVECTRLRAFAAVRQIIASMLLPRLMAVSRSVSSHLLGSALPCPPHDCKNSPSTDGDFAAAVMGGTLREVAQDQECQLKQEALLAAVSPQVFHSHHPGNAQLTKDTVFGPSIPFQCWPNLSVVGSQCCMAQFHLCHTRI